MVEIVLWFVTWGLVFLGAAALCFLAAAVFGSGGWQNGRVVLEPGACEACGCEGVRLICGRCDGCRESARPRRGA